MIRSFLSLSAGALLIAATLPAQAHDAWAEPVPVYRINHKHLDQPPEDYPMRRLVSLQVRDTLGEGVSHRLLDGPQGALVHAEAPAARIDVVIDNGVWTESRTHGYRRGPARAFASGTTTKNFMKYGKSILAWSPDATVPSGHRLEIVPTRQPEPGEDLRVRVLHDGEPLAGVAVTEGAGDAQQRYETDAQGYAAVPISALPAQFAVRHSAPSARPTVDETQMVATLYLGAQHAP